MVERSRSWLERMVKRVVAYSAIGFVDWEVEQVFYGWVSKERNKRSGPRERGINISDLDLLSTPARV